MPPEPDTCLALDRRDAVVLLALLLLAAVVLWPALCSGDRLAPGLPGHDGRTQWYPWREFAARWMRRGVLPLWNPYVLCGTPFVGNFQSALFYPPNLMFVVMPVHVAARASVFLHIGLSLFLAYLLARAMGCGRAGASATAVSFAFGSAQLLRVTAGHWGVLCAIPWLALILLGVHENWREPRPAWVLLGGLGVAAQILAGAPQYVFMSGAAVLVFAVVMSARSGPEAGGLLRRWGAVAAVFVVGACLAGIQLLPGVEAAVHGARSLPMRKEWVEQFSLAPESLLTMVVPGFFGGTADQPWWGRFLLWEMNAYFGVVALALGAAGFFVTRGRKRRLRLAIVAVAMLVLALGRHTPLMDVWLCLPLSGMLRGSAKFLLPFQLFTALLAGLGLDALLRYGHPKEIARGAALILVFFALVWGLQYAAAFGDLTERLSKWIGATGERLSQGGATAAMPAWGSLIAARLLLASTGLWAVALAWWAGRRPSRTPSWFGAAACLIVAVDMLLFARLFVRRDTNFRAVSSWPDRAAKHLRAREGGYRTFVLGDPNVNDGMLEDVPTLEGIEPNPPLRFHILFRRAQGLPVDVAPSLYQVVRSDATGLLTMTGVKHILIFPGTETRMPADWPVTDLGDARIADLPGAWPRAFVSYGSPSAKSAEGGAGGVLRPAESGRATAKIVHESPNRVVVEAKTERGGWLVLLDSYYPGWRASVDGRRAEIRQANGCFRAVRIPPGTHLASFTYLPSSFLCGSGLSALCLIGVVAWAVVRLRRRGRREGPDGERFG